MAEETDQVIKGFIIILDFVIFINPCVIAFVFKKHENDI